jgi:IS5 family transposase
MANLNSITCDATCYECSIRYPTDTKLLFECVMWSYGEVWSLSKKQKVRKPRTKIKKWIPLAISYSKMKRKTKK